MYTDAQCRRTLARLRAVHVGVSPLRSAKLAGVMAVIAVATAFTGGCGSKNAVHPGLQIEGQELDRAVARGKNLVALGSAPEEAFAYRIVDVNQRVSSEVILRSAGLCMPADRIAYEIAKAGDSSDSGLRRATAAGLKSVERELMCVAEVQIPNTMDPAAIMFALRGGMGTEYPPIAVETPTLLREFKPAYDPTAAPAGIYYYIIRFPVQGGPGIPAIGPTVSSLTLVVSDGTAEATYTFPLPRVETDL